MSDHAGGRPRRCLVVDEDQGLRGYVMRCIERCAVPIHVIDDVADGADALGIVRERDVELVVCDVFLTGMGGIDLVAALRGDPRLAGIPVLLMTAETLGHTERAYLDRLPSVQLIGKPFNARTFCAAIRSLLTATEPI